MRDKVTQILYDGRLKIIAFWIILILGNVDLIQNDKFYVVIFSDFFIASLSVFLTKSKRLLIRYFAMLFIGMSILLSIINYLSFSLFHLGISVKLWVILLETNTAECLQYLVQLLPHIQWLWFFVIILVIFVLTKAISHFKNIKFILVLFLVLNIFGVIAGSYIIAQPFGKKRVSIVCRSILDFSSAINIKFNSSLFLHENKTFQYEAKMDSANFDKVVFIIGESMSRFHMSLYQYRLETTPCLNSMKDSMYVFDDAVSPFTGTSEVMQRLLTFKSVRDSLNWYDFPSLMDVLSQTEYKTYWFSNQEKAGAWGDCSGTISSRADFVKYVGMEYSGDHSYEVYDEKLIDEFRRSVKTNQKQFFVLHMMGSHPLYNRRYPPEKSIFSKQDYDLEKFNERECQTKAEYDNSIHYTDSLLHESIRIISDDCANERVLWIYLSDHGQDVFDFSDNVGHIAQSVEIPLIIFLNEKARKENPLIASQLRKCINRKIMTDDFIHSLFMLMNISYPVIDSSKSFVSDSFNEKERITDGKVYQYKSANKVKQMQHQILK